VSGYLTREQATAELVADGSSAREANAILSSALRTYPQSHRTNFHMVTGYKAGTCCLGPHPDGYTREDLFTIGRW
jgi:hypothetical protein